MGNQKTSTDIAAFNNLVTVPLQIKEVRWEMFSTPEDTGGVPGPTDYVTLVAEIEPPTQPVKAWSVAPSQPVEIVPGAARPWLGEPFRTLLSQHEEKPLEMSDATNCGPIKAKLRKTNEPIAGFVCVRGDKALLYLTLLDRTEGK